MLTLLILALALSADGFAVSIVRGAASTHRWQNAVWTGVVFGACHAAMVAIGWVVGDIMEAWKSIAPYIACLMLVMLGGKMLWESWIALPPTGQAPEDKSVSMAFLGLLWAALATSVDAVAAGVTLPLMGFTLLMDATLIGLIVGLVSIIGYQVGSFIGAQWGKWAETLGGFCLIGVGLKFIILP